MENECSCSEDYHSPGCPTMIPGKAASLPDLIAEYDAVLQRIYDERTAGDFTFTGVLAAFLFEAKEFVSE